MRFLSSLLLLAVLAVPATAQPWFATGEFNGWGTGNGSSVNPIDPFPMVDQGGGHYTATIGADGDLFDNQPFNWKIRGTDWVTTPNMPSSDSRVYTNAEGKINFHLYDQTTWNDGWSPNNTRRVGYDDPQQFGWEIVGSFNSWPSETHDPTYALTDMGNGLYHGSFAFPKGIYDFKYRGITPLKASPNAAWDTAIGTDFGNGAGNNSFAVTTNGDIWNFELDLPKGRFRYFTNAPAPGQNGDYNNNGIVDAADYTKWRDNLGTTNILPHDPTGGTIGIQQYNTWKANFGASTPLSWLAHSPQLPDQQLVSVGAGKYELNLSGLTASSDYEFKVVRSDLAVSVPGSNMKVRADASGNIGLKFYELTSGTWSDGWSPTNASRVGYTDSGQFDWQIVGDFQNPTWPPTNDPNFFLVDQGNGLHTGTFTFTTPGSFNFKFRQQDPTNPWNTSIGPDFGNSAGNNTFTITNPGEVWHFELDLPNGRWRAFKDGSGSGANAVPEPGSVVLALLGLLAGAAVRRRS